MSQTSHSCSPSSVEDTLPIAKVKIVSSGSDNPQWVVMQRSVQNSRFRALIFIHTALRMVEWLANNFVIVDEKRSGHSNSQCSRWEIMWVPQ